MKKNLKKLLAGFMSLTLGVGSVCLTPGAVEPSMETKKSIW